MALDSRTPSGTAPVGSRHDSGIDTVNVSEGEGAEVGAEYGQTMAWVVVKARAW